MEGNEEIRRKERSDVVNMTGAQAEQVRRLLGNEGYSMRFRAVRMHSIRSKMENGTESD